MLLDLFRLFETKGGLGKESKAKLYKNGFFFGSGIFAGIFLDNIWHVLNLGGTDKNLLRAGNAGPSLVDTKQDQMMQSILITAILLGSIITGKYTAEVIPTAIGAYVGSNWSNQSEKNGKGINVLPF